jgi:asparagine synthase (glutamine-hydrolysing)
MRGIAGIVRFDQDLVPPDDIRRMVQMMAIAPMDRTDSWCENSAAFAHLIQFLLPHDRLEQQPLRSHDGHFVLVTDALLDNRAELAAQFGWGATEAAAKPDSAFVLAAFECWGTECPSHLEGRFAFAIWDCREHRLFCAIDHLGYHPFYYWRTAVGLAFATTIRGLFALPGVSRELNENAFAAHVVRIPTEDRAETLYRDVKRLLGGHRMTIDAAGCRIVRYWNPVLPAVLRLRSDAEYIEAFRHELERAVRTSLQHAPRSAGIMISGGLDSSSLTAVAGKILAEQGRRLQAFHLVSPGQNLTAGPWRTLDESRFVELLQQRAPHIDFHFLSPHRESAALEDWDQFFEEDQVPFVGLPERFDRAQEQLLDQYCVDVLLNGGGGNHLASLECYPSGYLGHLFFTGRWLTWAREVRGNSRVYGRSVRHLIRHSVFTPIKNRLRPTTNHRHLLLLHPDLRARTGIESKLLDYQASWDAVPWSFRSRLHRVLAEEFTHQVGVTRSAIRRNTSHRLGAAPLFDRRFNEFCLSLPPDQQIRAGQDRRLMRESMRDLLPDEVRLRVTRGFPQPGFHQTFSQMEPVLRRELDRLAECAVVRQYLDLTSLRSRINSKEQNSPPALVAGVVLGRFIEWHKRTGKERLTPHDLTK